MLNAYMRTGTNKVHIGLLARMDPGPALAWRSPLFLIAASLSTVLWMVLTWMPWIRFLCGRTCILLWILYGDMVDFSFIVSLYVSDLPNVTIRYTSSARIIENNQFEIVSVHIRIYIRNAAIFSE